MIQALLLGTSLLVSSVPAPVATTARTVGVAAEVAPLEATSECPEAPAPAAPLPVEAPAFVVPVALQPFGEFDSAMLDMLAGHVRTVFPANVTVLPKQSLPADAYYTPRNRYRADTLLRHLDRSTPKLYTHVIGITNKDISVTNGSIPDWGTMGVAKLAGRPGMVSTFRLGRAAPAPKLQERLNNVVVHELGHTFGLPHCEADGCVMQDAHGSIRPVDSTSGRFCPSCAQRLATVLPPRSATPPSLAAGKL